LVERTWRSDILDSTEDFTLHEVGSGFRLAGSMRILRGDHHVALTYLVETRGDWHTRAARVEIPALGADLDIRTGDSKSWWVDGEQVPELKGCIDIDLGWTPATNTLPLRRAEESGETSFVTRAAWLRWPALRPRRSAYTKHGDTTGTIDRQLRPISIWIRDGRDHLQAASGLAWPWAAPIDSLRRRGVPQGSESLGPVMP
jgi:hypothetical protein